MLFYSGWSRKASEELTRAETLQAGRGESCKYAGNSRLSRRPQQVQRP